MLLYAAHGNKNYIETHYFPLNGSNQWFKKKCATFGLKIAESGHFFSECWKKIIMTASGVFSEDEFSTTPPGHPQQGSSSLAASAAERTEDDKLVGCGQGEPVVQPQAQQDPHAQGPPEGLPRDEAQGDQLIVKPRIPEEAGAARTATPKAVDVNFCTMEDAVKDEVIGIVRRCLGSPAGELHTECSRAVKKDLEAKFGGIWVAFVGEDFGAVFNGSEFRKGTLAHFTMDGRGIMLYRCKFSK